MKLVKRYVLLAFLAAGAAGYTLLLWHGPWWIDGAHLRTRDLQPADGVVITGFRTALVALGAGLIAAGGLFYTHRTLQHTRDKDQEQAEIAREGQVTDRYVEAIKLLGSANLTERLGGIYALQRIMHDSRKDHLTVVNVLAAYVRTHHSAPGGHQDADRAGHDRARTHPLPEDIRTALTVISGRPARDLPGERVDLRGIDFRRADLRGMSFAGMDLGGADLREADLRGAALRGADLSGAGLREANLRGAGLVRARLAEADLQEANLRDAMLWYADLRGANLQAADLTEADLEGADLTKANLRGANFLHADLSGTELQAADLRGIDLENVDLKTVPLSDHGYLAADQLARARLRRSTRLPPELARDAGVLARMAACEAAGQE
ncbi:pentapeptide repeat-containing protein, partial [Streptomyces rimosus]|uniref:pentapeptide repeat-containing protein n=1 Tax=Streptomyces rimosus TaxID=1927 RepID=UPI0004C85FE0